MSSHEKLEKNLLIIDTDCGVDDAMALLLVLSYSESWDIVAITCCHGNTTVDNACNNVLKVLNLCGQTNIPVYRGCDKPLVPLNAPTAIVHGDDGLGNVGHEYSSGSLQISDGHAVNVLVNIARENAGNVHLLALAPLTNVAMAHRMDPDFTKHLKSLTFMGGNVHGIGNTTSAAEFNFRSDPEAAHIVVSEVLCPTTMVPWETTLKHPIPWNLCEEFVLKLSGNKGHFVKKIVAFRAEVCRRRNNPGLLDCDVLPAVSLLCPQSAADFISVHSISVEIAHQHTRGVVRINNDIPVGETRRKPFVVVTEFVVRLLNAQREKIFTTDALMA